MHASPRAGRLLTWLALLLLSTLGAWSCVAARAGADEVVYVCGANANSVFYESDVLGMEEQQTCGEASGTMQILTSSNSVAGADSYWATIVPGGLELTRVSVGTMSVYGINGGNPFGGGFFWGPDASEGTTVGVGETGFDSAASSQPGFPTTEFGFQMICEAGGGCGPTGANFEIGNVSLFVAETSGPSVSASGLWNQSGWVRGVWPITVTGDSPSGICSLSASISGDPDSANGAMAPNQTVYHQCNGSLASSLDTTYAADGADTLTVSDSDAAGLSNSATETLEVDNQAPTVSLSGPASALSTAGTQYVTASVGAGPSGAYGADCSVDGGPQTFYAGASPQVPVSGVGQHAVTCTGLNNAMDASGQRASSAPASTTLDIQQPTEEAITFSKIADGVKCARVLKRVRVLGKPRTIRLHGHSVQVRRYHTVTRHVRRCQARTVRRRVLVPLEHHGRVVRRDGHVVRVRRWRRVVLLPHRVHRTVRHIRHGRRTTVSGVLLQSDGTPLAGQTITVLAAPNDADPQFSVMSSATTNADGVWIAKVPAGPSRLIQAQYAGTSTAAAASSTLVKLMVPARVRILTHTARVAWGQTVVFTGRVDGGYIPRGGVNLRLRYAYKQSWATYGVKTHVAADGEFRTRFTFGPGPSREYLNIRFRFSTLPGGDYPWSHAQSNIVAVRVGGHPRSSRHRRRPRHKRPQ
jgi:hypothetical protein